MEKIKLISASLSLIILTATACGQHQPRGNSNSTPNSAKTLISSPAQPTAQNNSKPVLIAFKQEIDALKPPSQQQGSWRYSGEDISKVRAAMSKLLLKIPTFQAKDDQAKDKLKLEQERLKILYLLMRPLAHKNPEDSISDIKPREFGELEMSLSNYLNLSGQENKKAIEALSSKLAPLKSNQSIPKDENEKIKDYTKLVQLFILPFKSGDPDGDFGTTSSLQLYKTLNKSATDIENSLVIQPEPTSPPPNPIVPPPGASSNEHPYSLLSLIISIIALLASFNRLRFLSYFLQKNPSTGIQNSDHSIEELLQRIVKLENLPKKIVKLEASNIGFGNSEKRLEVEIENLHKAVKTLRYNLSNALEEYNKPKQESPVVSKALPWNMSSPYSGRGISYKDNLPYQTPLLTEGMNRLLQTYQSSPRDLNVLAKVSESPASINQRRTNPNLTPELVESNNFNYLVVQDLESSHVFWLFPKNNLKVNQYNIETVETLFECQNYVNSSTATLQVLQPASVSKNVNSWRLIEKGIIIFND